MTTGPKTSARNRAIYSASLFGMTLPEIGAQYGLAMSTVKAILSIEAHKREVSLEPAYREMRNEPDACQVEPGVKVDR
jgi:predicted transcriptional regulator